MKPAQRLTAVLLAILLVAAVAAGQAPQSKKKSYTFKGKVEAISEKGKNLTVNGEDVPGWMAAMTMVYEVDDPAVLKKIKVGDRIAATVYDDDTVLHKVQVVPPAAADKSKKQ